MPFTGAVHLYITLRSRLVHILLHRPLVGAFSLLPPLFFQTQVHLVLVRYVCSEQKFPAIVRVGQILWSLCSVSVYSLQMAKGYHCLWVAKYPHLSQNRCPAP